MCRGASFLAAQYPVEWLVKTVSTSCAQKTDARQASALRSGWRNKIISGENLRM